MTAAIVYAKGEGAKDTKPLIYNIIRRRTVFIKTLRHRPDQLCHQIINATMSEQKITIRLLYFASVREATSKSEEQIQIPANTTCAQLLVRLSTSYPSLLSMMADLSTAVNEKYVDTNTVLKDRDTVAVMPPISGG